MYELSYSKSSLKNLIRLPEDIRKKITDKLNQLKLSPHSQNYDIKKLEGLDGYRMRVGNYRIIYKIENRELRILIIATGIRGGIYK